MSYYNNMNRALRRVVKLESLSQFYLAKVNFKANMYWASTFTFYAEIGVYSNLNHRGKYRFWTYIYKQGMQLHNYHCT